MAPAFGFAPPCTVERLTCTDATRSGSRAEAGRAAAASSPSGTCMRLTGLGAVRARRWRHFLILHFSVGPGRSRTPSWIADSRWSSIFWRGFDWLLLMFVLFHAFMGVRIVVGDYTRGGVRTVLTWPCYLLARSSCSCMGTIVVVTLPERPCAMSRPDDARSITTPLIVGAGGAGLWAALELRARPASTPRS